jgi:DNA mismatch endonuclease (patch repair protein)
MDTFSPKQRSRIMSMVHSRGNKSTEIKFIKLLKKSKITGWRRCFKIVGNPDFVFPKNKMAIFIDGCFWHGCPRHLRLPATNKKYWQQKVASNILRDNRVNKLLKERGWKICRFWEHELMDLKRLSRVIIRENI